MTFLPIVERELRVAARRKGTYLARVGVGLGATVLGGVAGLTALLNPSVRFGTIFFQTLSWLAMVYCLGAGRFLTADCLSGEKREGTMGLLFLTDLKGYDVVLGKLAATSLNGLYGLLAVLPVLAITLLTGGVSSGEFCRVALVLLDTFFFSLAIGIFASALTREFWAAMALNFSMLLALAGFLPALAGLHWFFHPSTPPAQDWFLPCPVYTLVLAFDAPYKLQAAQFWSSASLILAMSWLLVALACEIVPRSWQDKPAKQAKPQRQQAKGLRSRGRAFRIRLLEQNAYYWLAARPRWKAHLVWVVIGLALLWVGTMAFTVGWLDEYICLLVALMLNGTFKFWIILEAGQRLAADAKSGAFELLLSTPLAAREIVRGQILALRRQFLKPLLAVAGIELYLLWSLMAGPAHLRSFSPSCVFCLGMAGILMLAADAVTLSVVGMEAALAEQNQARASVKTAGRVLALPWLLWAGLEAIVEVWTYLFPETGFISWKFHIGSWFAIGMVLDFLFARAAWRRLTGSFRELALRRFGPAPARASLLSRCAKTGRAIRDHLWSRPRNRKWAAGFAALLVIGSLLAVWESNRSHDPPPEVVVIGPSDGTALQAIAASPGGVYLVLPDGSLWRWGLTERTNRAALPERVGPNRDWRMVSVNGPQRLGVRRDGTLWQWQTNGAFTQVGVDHDWVEAVGGPAYKVARKKDGTLWTWGDIAMSNAPPSSPPVWIPSPTATNHIWKAQQASPATIPFPIPNAMVPRVVINQALVGGAGAITTRRIFPGLCNLAVDSDDTLWMWGSVFLAGSFPGIATASLTNWVNYYSDPIQVCRETNWVGFVAGRPQNKQGETWDLFAAPPNPAESITSIGNLFHSDTPVQVGTNRDWTAVESTWNGIVAVRLDGSLWGWGEYQDRIKGRFPPIRYSQPTQLCAETNWLGFDRSFGLLLARNNAGDYWWLRDIGMYYPDAAASVSSFGTLLARASSSNQPLQTINPFRAGASRYEIHPNGTLWVSPLVLSAPIGTGVIQAAAQAGLWTNWLAVANVQNTAFGLTADGTLWTWGWNLGVEPTVATRSRIEVAKLRAAAALGMRSPSLWTPASATPTYPIQYKPRALMRLAPEKEF
jgi:ABC-type transport system involved in multi-copper enzyme maturation permease subunit